MCLQSKLPLLSLSGFAMKISAWTPAAGHYARIGSREAKLAALLNINTFADLTWRSGSSEWIEGFEPPVEGASFSWPRLTDLFPWQENGIEFRRPWPIGETVNVLNQRWNKLLDTPASKKGTLLGGANAQKIFKTKTAAYSNGKILPPLSNLKSGTAPVAPRRYAFRSFDRQWIIPDFRLRHRLSPHLMYSDGSKQVYMTSLLTEVLGDGPTAVATVLMPDYHHFRGSFGERMLFPYGVIS